MTRKIVLTLLLLFCTLVAGGLLVTWWHGASRTAESYYAEARRYFEEGSYRTAAIQLKNALQRDPGHRDARYLLALSHVESGNGTAAERELQRLVQRHPGDTEAELLLGNLYLAAGMQDAAHFNQAKMLANRLLERDPRNVKALILLANAESGVRDFSDSIRSLQTALDLDPDNLLLHLNLGAFQAAGGNFSEAERILLRARTLAPADPAPCLALANLYVSAGKFDAAESRLVEALALRSGDPQVFQAVAGFYLTTGRPEKAVSILESADRSDPGNPDPGLLVTDLHRVQGHSDRAVIALEALYRRFPENGEVARKLAAVTLHADPNRAEAVIQELLRRDPDNPANWLLEAMRFYYRAENAEAEKIFQKSLLAESGYPQSHYFLGKIAASRNDFSAARAHFERAVSLSPDFLPAAVAVAGLDLIDGYFDSARKRAEVILKRAPGHLEAGMIRIGAVVASGADPETAARLRDQLEQRLKEAWKQQPDAPPVVQALVDLYIQTGRTQQALDILRQVPRQRWNAIHYRLAGRLHLSLGDPEAAREALLVGLQKEPANPETGLMLAAACLKAGRVSEGVEWTDRLIARHPKLASPHALRGFIHLSQGELAPAAMCYTESLRLDPNDASAANNLAYVLVLLDRDLDRALMWARTARKLEPENPQYADTLGWVYFRNRNYVLAVDQLRFAVEKQPEAPLLRFHLAMALWKAGDRDTALQHLQYALESRLPFAEREEARQALVSLQSSPVAAAAN